MRLIFLRAHLRMLAAGMKNSRLSGTAILKLVSAHTGRDYKRGQYVRALADVQMLMNGEHDREISRAQVAIENASW